MTRTFLGCAAALLAAVAATPRPAAAADESRPPAALKLVPPDAAVFVHIDVEKVWKSKLGDTFRKVRAREIDQGLKFLKETGGVTPDDVKTLTFFLPKVKQDGPPPFGLVV